MKNKNQKNLKLFLTGFATISILVASLFLLKGCCDTQAKISVIRGDLPPNEKTGGDTEVFICPGEPVTLGWYVSKDVTQITISGLGSISVNDKKFKTVNPTETTKYTIVATGNCQVTQYCTVNVIVDGAKAQIAAKLVRTPPKPSANLPEQIHWEKTLPPEIWSPNIYFTSIRMMQFNETAWNQSSNWRFIKTDTDGSIKDFDVTWTFSTPWGTSDLQAVGNWKVMPIGGTYPNTNYPWFANFEATMKCKK